MTDPYINDVTDPDARTPDELTVDIIAEDLTLANDEGTGWFQYRQDGDDIVVEQWGDDRNPGEIVATWRMKLEIVRE